MGSDSYTVKEGRPVPPRFSELVESPGVRLSPGASESMRLLSAKRGPVCVLWIKILLDNEIQLIRGQVSKSAWKMEFFGGWRSSLHRKLHLQKLLLVLCYLHVSTAQIQSLRQKRQQPVNMPTITGLDVTCEKTGMTVNLQFSAPFNGVVFSKGHFSNPACR